MGYSVPIQAITISARSRSIAAAGPIKSVAV